MIMVVKQMKKDIERESYEEWVWSSSVRLSETMVIKIDAL